MRNYNDRLYKAWRRKIKERDNYTCRMPNCGMRKRLNVHHIKRWADFPYLRYEVYNGITLCKKCHNMVTGQEHLYEKMFTEIVNSTVVKMDDNLI